MFYIWKKRFFQSGSVIILIKNLLYFIHKMLRLIIINLHCLLFFRCLFVWFRYSNKCCIYLEMLKNYWIFLLCFYRPTVAYCLIDDAILIIPPGFECFTTPLFLCETHSILTVVLWVRSCFSVWVYINLNYVQCTFSNWLHTHTATQTDGGLCALCMWAWLLPRQLHITYTLCQLCKKSCRFERCRAPFSAPALRKKWNSWRKYFNWI